MDLRDTVDLKWEMQCEGLERERERERERGTRRVGFETQAYHQS